MARHQTPPVLPRSSFSMPITGYGAVSFRSIPTSVPMFSSQKALGDAVASPEALESLGRILPVKTLAKLYGDFISEGALRALIWSAEAYEKDPKPGLRSNGFLPVIVRPPNQRKVLLDRVEFEKWLTSQQRTAR